MAYEVSSMNKVILIGRVGGDPEAKYTPNGTAVTKFSLATSEKWKTDSGDKQEKTEWHKIITWRKQAEFVAEWVKKGALIIVEGKLQTRSWEDNGVKKYITEVIASSITPLSTGKSSDSSSKPKEQATGNETDDEDDDLPF